MKKFIKFAFVAAIAAVAGYNVYHSKNADRNLVFSLTNIEELAYGESSSGDSGYNPICHNGGFGANSCSIGGGIDIAGYGVSLECSVSCNSGFYACCGIRCTCKKV